jgi:hypothetical protein
MLSFVISSTFSSSFFTSSSSSSSTGSSTTFAFRPRLGAIEAGADSKFITNL